MHTVGFVMDLKQKMIGNNAVRALVDTVLRLSKERRSFRVGMNLRENSVSSFFLHCRENVVEWRPDVAALSTPCLKHPVSWTTDLGAWNSCIGRVPLIQCADVLSGPEPE